MESRGRWTIWYTLFLLGVVAVSACHPEAVESEEELIAYIRDEDNGLYKKTNRNGVDVELLYRPLDLIVNQELQAKSEVNDSIIQSLEDQYGKYAYFVLSYSQDDKEALYARSGSYTDFSENLQKLAYRMNEYAWMSSDKKDTLYLSDFYFPRMHGMGQSTQVLLAFEREEINESDEVTLHLKDVGFGTGRVNFKINTKDIKKIPRIISKQ